MVANFFKKRFIASNISLMRFDRTKLVQNFQRDRSWLSTTIHAPNSYDEKTKRNENYKTKQKSKMIDFNNAQLAHATKLNIDLIRSLFVYKVCQIPFIVNNASSLLSLSNKLLGMRLTNSIIKNTFFDQFCAGEDVISIQSKMTTLKKNGIEAIFDYAAENDSNNDLLQNDFQLLKSRPYNQPARIYDYKSEKQCNSHMNTFKSCIKAAAKVSPNGKSFAAVKVTALGNPILLERCSNAINQIKGLFVEFDVNNDGILTRTEFEDGFHHLFYDSTESLLPALLEKLDPNNTRTINYIEFSRLFTPSLLPKLTSKLRNTDSELYRCTLTPEEIQMLESMYARAHSLSKLAFESNVRLLFDAEQTFYQPAIDSLVLSMQETFNDIKKTDIPVIFHTYQCYLKDTLVKLNTDLERSKRFSYHFGAKLVRGAYMNTERERAETGMYESPVHDCIEDTHKCYDQAIKHLLKYEKQKSLINVEIMCATHNQESIEKALKCGEELGTDNNVLHFAQLLGMSDNITYPLGQNGSKVYKYAPFGKVHEVIPYLLRRLEENGNVFSNAKQEEEMVLKEMRRRITYLFR